MIYLFVSLGSLAVDLIPVVAPPAWTVMAFLLVKYHLNPWLVLAGCHEFPQARQDLRFKP